MFDIILYIICFVFGAAGAWLIIRIGSRFSLLDIPNHRSSHKGIIAKGGGIGILAAFIFISLILKMPIVSWLPASIISLLSLSGDRIEISPKLRLAAQVVAALIFNIFSTLNLQFSVTSILLTIFFTLFIVATANWYNFMDGINGIAAITGVCSFGILALFNYIIAGDYRLTVLAVCIAISCLGFLPYNCPNAKVFMGDVGSILLGFVFAVFVIMLSKSFLDFVCLSGFLFPFYADEFVTMFVRLKEGENLLKPHRRHLYQLLANEMCITHWKVSVGYGILQLVVGGAILLTRPLGILPVIFLLSVVFTGFIYLNYIVRMKLTLRNRDSLEARK